MITVSYVLLFVAALAPVSTSVPAERLSPTESARADSIRNAILEARTAEEEWLRTSPTSYLAAINRVDFGERTSLTIGSGEGADVVVPERVFRPRHCIVTVVGDSFQVRADDPEATFRTRTEEGLREATLPPGYIYVDRFAIRLSHQRYPAIIVFDPKSPRYAEYKGLTYYPVDLSYRFVLDMVVNDEPDTVVILSTRGNNRNALREGWFRFNVGGVACTLEVNRLLEPGIGETSYSVFFRDRTSGKETYPVGRYVDVERLVNGQYVLDFNKAYNPACAFSPFYNCPLPPEANDLPVAITAGEKDAHYGEH